METARTRALKGLAGSMPVANQRVAQGLQQARLVGLQQAVAGTPAPAGRAEVQQAGAQQVGQAAKIQTGAAAAGIEQATQIGRVGLAEQERASVEQVGNRRLDVERRSRANEADLASMNRDLKQRLFDDRVRFKTDETGRAVLNEYQLADWAIRKSKSEAQARSYMQKMELAHKRRMEMLRIAEQKITQQMEFEAKKTNQARDHATYERLAAAKHNISEKIRREQADQANKQAMWQTGGTIVGAVAGSYFGPAGTVVGASVGGAVGGAIGSAVG